MFYIGITIAILFVITLLDALKVVDYARGIGLVLTAVIYPHMVLLCYLAYDAAWEQEMRLTWILFLVFAGIFLLYWLIHLHIFPFRRDRSGNRRVKILYGGRLLIYYGLWMLLFQSVWYTVLAKRVWNFCSGRDVVWVFWTDLIVCLLLWLGILGNGVLRVVCTSRQLGIFKRILVMLFFWVPVLHLCFLFYLCRKAREEYVYECCRHEIREQRSQSDICATKYPILMLHGVGFRDHKMFSYWGRVPKELVRNGAVIYYGHQEGWGVTEENAMVIRDKILQMLAENHCDKVNIIAHSKGGIDARYAIGALGMGDKVASLTTVCTPHHGSPLVPYLRQMPEGLYRFICRCIDWGFRAYGDERPDVYRSGLELDPAYCDEFNRKYPDHPGIYYQSYTSVMKGWYSELFCSIPYLVLKRLAGDNDGLVPEESAKWGNFRGTIRPVGRRGVSHADMIDLHQEDYKGFDVIEFYVKIVNELKMMGL
ncbi:MAG: triacylglycerol lipase [Lachnospiraceae bacterium]|nr:triacylglycerol lipase [Lachnospiraceae bacterium]